MEPLLAQLQGNALLFGLMSLRVGALFATAPVLSSRSIPMRVKGGLTIALVLSVLPLMASQPGMAVPDDGVSYIVLAAKELIIGATIGLIAQMLFAAVQLAGSFIDISAGFAIASTIDPVNNVNLTVLGRAYNMIVTAAFIAVGGHLILMQALLASFTLVSPTETPNMAVLMQGVTTWSAELFVIALQLAAPLMAALFISDVAFGIMSRAAPQMNVFAVGLPFKVAVALVGSAFLLPAFITHFDNTADRMFSSLSDILTGAG